jgi:hypothetical protein
MRKLIITIAIAAGLMSTTGCGPQEDDMDDKTIEAAAAQARADIDALAALLGTSPEVRQDVISDCIPGNDTSGKTLDYAVRVQVEAGTLRRLKTEVAEQYEADGWQVKLDPGTNSVRFAKGSETMGARVFEDRGSAVVSGSGGCVR